MSQLIESIRIANGAPKNIKSHQERVNSSYKELFNKECPFLLQDVIPIPEKVGEIYKCRILYNENVQEIDVSPYIPSIPKKVKKVIDNDIDYHLKFADRSRLNALMESREDCDEILIIRNGLITDASKYNVLLFNGDNWVTPKNPLLKGTLRNALLERNMVVAKDIPLDNLDEYSYLLLVNALNPFNPSHAIPVNCIY
jgi:4-amino-4-deoxychorismate lyase